MYGTLYHDVRNHGNSRSSTLNVPMVTCVNTMLTSMHCRIMRTALLLTVSVGAVCIGGGESAQPRGVCIWEVCPNLWGVCIQGGGGFQIPGGWGGGLHPGDWEDHTPPVNRMTDRCKTFPCPKLRLREVNIKREIFTH